jgi:hypothetical protein
MTAPDQARRDGGRQGSPHLADHAETIAHALLGEPNRELSTKAQLRFRTHGSLAVEVKGCKAGQWYDHEAETGGGLLDLIIRERGGTRRDSHGLDQAVARD